MDSKESLIRKITNFGRLCFIRKVPIIGFVVALLASAAFYLCHAYDQKVWQTLYNYHSEHLLEKEQLLYQDFYQKRLAIEQKGSEAQLKVITDAITQQDKKALTYIILSDRSFRDFLSQKASIYFSTKQKDHWLSHNTTLTKHLNQLSSYRFALIPEQFIASPSIANLVTYNFVDTSLVNFLSNIFILLILCCIIEQYLKRSWILGAFLMASIIYACSYLFVADSFTPPLQSLNGIVYFFCFALFSAMFKAQYPTRFSNSKLLVFIGLCILAVKITLDIYMHLLTAHILTCLIPLCLFGLILGWLVTLPTAIKTESLPSDIKPSDFLSKQTRHLYSEAMTGLSRFNFRYARQVLEKLRSEQPNSLNILESSYHLEKLQPDESSFWTIAETRIEHCLVSQNYLDMVSIFQDVQKAAPSRLKAGQCISADHYLKILIVFVNHGDTEKAERAFMFLELAGNEVLVKEACKLLIERFSQAQNIHKKEHYMALLESYAENT